MLTKIKYLIFFIFLLSIKAIPSNCPIIFVHGHRSEARPEGSSSDPNDKSVGGWVNWYPRDYNGNFDYPTAMTKIADSHYGGYSYGLKSDGSTAHLCDKTTRLMITPDTRRIYHFSFYRPDGGIGVIGSNGSLECQWVLGEDGERHKKSNLVPWEWLYGYDYGSFEGVPFPLSGDKWAENLANFIDSVLVKTGASQVDIVAHSMGGLVARAAIKYYGCDSKVRKLLTVGTPNHYFDNTTLEDLYLDFACDDPSWMLVGEQWEMSTDVGEGEWNVTFKDISSELEEEYTEFLDVSPSGEIATIAGKKGWSVGTTNDCVVTVDQVHLSSAQFNPVIYASHSTGFTDFKEFALNTCTYTTEFIKKWIIDDETITNASLIEDTYVHPSPWPSVDNFCGGLRGNIGVNSYQNVLSLVSRIKSIGNNPVTDWQGIPLYRCIKEEMPGNPVIVRNPGNIASGIYWYEFRINDMNHGEVALSSTDNFGITLCEFEYNGAKIKGSFINIERPGGGEYIAGNKIWIRWASNEYVLSKKIYFSTDGGNTYEEIFILGSRTTLEEEPWIKDSVEWTIPVVMANQCKIKVIENLDNVTYISDESETFSIPGDITLQNDTVEIGETETYQVYNSITAQNFLILGNGSNGGNVTMVAGDIIYLKPGFEAREGCNFHAYADPSIRGYYEDISLVNSEIKSLTIKSESKKTEKDSTKTSTELSSKEIKEEIPKVFSCAQNYPNPFMNKTTIKYGLPKNSDVNLTIFNIAGQVIRTLVNSEQLAGFKSVSWDGKNNVGITVPQGIYFYVFKAGNFYQTHKMILLD